MTPEVAVGEYQRDPDDNTERHASNHVQTAGHAADGKDACEAEWKQPTTRPTDPHFAYLHRCGGSAP
jgi:hypothetical protein